MNGLRGMSNSSLVKGEGKPPGGAMAPKPLLEPEPRASGPDAMQASCWLGHQGGKKAGVAGLENKTGSPPLKVWIFLRGLVSLQVE